jgi:plasmid stability protein
MSNLTIKSLPDELHEALRRAAERNHRSLNSEVIHRLESSLALRPADEGELMEQARVLRERARLPYLSDAELRALRDEGRA